jgi:RNA polymerase sigma-70 factor (ECF subfamily)
VVQNAFEKVLRNPWQFRGQARVSTWMHRIVVNEALMWLRSEGRRARRVADLDGILGAKLRDPCPTPLELLTQREQQGRLRAGIAALSPEEQEVLEQCAVEGLSYAELSERTGVHPGALKSRAFRARRRLSLLVGEA